MARKSGKNRKGSLVKKVLIVGGTLIVLQVGLILHFQQTTNPTNIRDEIGRQVDKTAGLSAERREQLRVQLAITDYRRNNHKFPASLDELRPLYFEQIPIDPATGAPFKYVVEGTRYILGEPQKKAASPSQGGGLATSTADLALDEQSALIASLDVSPVSSGYVYEPAGKREPFRPFDLSPKVMDDPTKTPLERYDIGQLKLTAVIAGTEFPAATVENQAGKGFIVRKGTKIGLFSGEVVEILPDRIKILETSTDFTGQKKTNVIEMVLRTKEFEDMRGRTGSGTDARRTRQ